MDLIAQIEYEKAEIEKINENIAEYERIIIDRNSRLGSESSTFVNDNLIKGQKNALESRINKLLKLKSEISATIQEYRNKIDNERKLRVVFDRIYKNYEEDLDQKKESIRILIEDNRVSPGAPEDGEKFENYKHRAEKEKTEFEKEMREFADLIRLHSLKKAKSKQLSKSQKLSDTSPLEASANRLDKPQTVQAPPNTIRGKRLEKASIREAPGSFSHLVSYEASLQRLLKQTGSADPQGVINSFSAMESQNFSIFNYINGVNTEAERLERAIDTLRLEVQRHKGRGLSTDAMRRLRAKDIAHKVLATEAKCALLEKRYAESTKLIDNLKTGVENILTRTSVGTAATNAVSQVTDNNLVYCLGLIEQRTSEVLLAYAASQEGTGSATLKLPQLALSHNKHKDKGLKGQRLQQYPEIADGLDRDGPGPAEDDEEERPFTRAELHKRVVSDLG